MRKVTLIMTSSIDGYVVKPDGLAVGAATETPELKRWKLDRIQRAGVHIMGRKTYEGMASFWPKSKDAYAAPMNDIPKVVFSNTLKRADWPESTIVSGDLATEINKLRRQRGGEIIAWGGASFAQSLARANLIDEYAVIFRPVAYGAGQPLFLDLPAAMDFRMLATTCFDDGQILRQMTPAKRSKARR
jgi:dihydrofolate reductase